MILTVNTALGRAIVSILDSCGSYMAWILDPVPFGPICIQGMVRGYQLRETFLFAGIDAILSHREIARLVARDLGI
jgi:hypothetical protein